MIALGNMRLGRVSAPAGTSSKHFFSPMLDFLLLGGLSLFLLPIALLLPSDLKSEMVVATAILALVINHPHFAHSYQIFYRGFQTKAVGAETSRGLRSRYLFAGIAVPLALAMFLSGSIAVGDLKVMGVAANLMALTVGWHYVKQGYGMLIVDGVQQKQFFGEPERRVLLLNAYAIWALTWISTNTAGQERDLFGVPFHAFALPESVQLIATAIATATSVAAGVMLFRRWSTKGLPVNGVVAYLVTLYLWMVFVRISPIWLLVVPALHSLQYLAIVWRHEINRDSAREDAFAEPDSAFTRRYFGQKKTLHFFKFVMTGVVLGLLGFWIAPLILEFTIPTSAAEASIFLFAFWVFINVHHYFIDNVIWRSENPDVKKYLFGQPQKALPAEEPLAQAA